MLRRWTNVVAGTLLTASVVFATACNEDGPSPTGLLKSPSGPTFLITTTTNVWDFVALIGGNNGDGGRGNTHTFTIAGAGSIVATVDPSPWELYRKGFFDPPFTEERGLGVCLDPGTGCTSPGDDEIGDVWPDGTMPAIVLDLTGLSSGTTITAATLASVQETEGWRVLASADGTTYNLLTEGTGSAATLPTLTFPVPPDTKFLRFEGLPCGTNDLVTVLNNTGGDNGGGCGGNNYLLQSVTTSTETNTGGGKDFSIGPSSMEGAIRISNGDWVNGGYSFKFVNGGHIATQFTVDAFVTITGPCSNGGTDILTIPLGSKTYSVPAGNTDWLPTGDANSVLSWQGSVVASGLCGGVGQLNASKGAVYHATVTQNPATGSLVNFRFKYRDPAAKGKPNTNCLNTSDPNRNKADVCGASWSQTVRDP